MFCRGGEEIVLDQAGKDGTVAFDEVGHSKDAHDQLRELLVGRLDQAVRCHGWPQRYSSFGDF